MEVVKVCTGKGNNYYRITPYVGEVEFCDFKSGNWKLSPSSHSKDQSPIIGYWIYLPQC
ncbi:hypothetical protein XIS1_480093 [Xenorhabdus innexi]|uniref:Uncharacterized protein n=1 Tax=Xenorhabdus innexi TaxID=290109 RepID=A0A1N6MYT0_9GAMM|nr:hypothetical protein XIS1_480093 [Xenorhabdus innexi]